MRIDYKGDGVCEFEGNEEEMAHVYGQGIAFMMLKGLYDMDDKDALEAFKTFAELNLRLVPPPIEDVPDEWAYWTPEHVNETTKSEHDKADVLKEWETFVKEGRIK